MKEEFVLVFNQNILDKYIKHGFKNGTCFDYDIITELVKEINGNTFFVERKKAEKDESIKQLIPYITLWRNESVFTFERTTSGGENRLHNKLSFGVGGHINLGDTGSNKYESGFWRELKEETGLDKIQNFDFNASIRGLIFDSSNEVGRVHFGIIHYIDLLPSQKLFFADKSINPIGFLNDSQLKSNYNKLENWSKLAMEQFK